MFYSLSSLDNGDRTFVVVIDLVEADGLAWPMLTFRTDLMIAHACACVSIQRRRLL